MRIAVNAQFLIDGKLEGLGWFTYEVLSRIVKQHPEHTFILIFNRPYPPHFVFAPNVEPVVVGSKYGHPLTWLLKFGVVLPRVLKRLEAELYLSPDGWCPSTKKIKQVAVIHDLNFIHHPAWLPFSFRTYYRVFFKQWARNAARLATVSEYSRQDIARNYGINPNNIDVVYNGANNSFSAIPEDEKCKVREKYTSNKSYFIFVGATPPRKNIINLFRAFDIFKRNNKGNHQLVLAGAKKWWADSIRETYENMEFRSDVVFTDRVSSDELNKLICASEALAYVSLFEGFGIPLVEAMYCETAIITSNCTSMPEVAGDAALLVDPHSPGDIAAAMQRILDEPLLRQTLIDNGKIRRTFFSWDKSASLLWSCVERAITN